MATFSLRASSSSVKFTPEVSSLSLFHSSLIQLHHQKNIIIFEKFCYVISSGEISAVLTTDPARRGSPGSASGRLEIFSTGPWHTWWGPDTGHDCCHELLSGHCSPSGNTLHDYWGEGLRLKLKREIFLETITCSRWLVWFELIVDTQPEHLCRYQWLL